MKFLIISIFLFVFVNADDYCDICKYHIACGNDMQLSIKCPIQTMVMDLDETNLKDLFVKMHNDKRNLIALGKLNKFQPAKRMATMQWDNELAKMAELNVMTCEFKHDKCRDTIRFHYSGQNLGQWKGFPPVLPTKAVESLVNRWFDEYKDCSMTIIDKYQKSSKTVGHFTVMVADRNTRVGCAVLKTVQEPFTTYTVACNYATTNLLGEPIYKKGRTASGCKTGKNQRYPGLCSPNEQIEPNLF